MTRMFGTDGVRGIANSPGLSPELAFSLGEAAAGLIRNGRNEPPLAAIGRDTRRSGPMLEAALGAGVMAAGGNVIYLGVATTPAVAYATHYLQADFGVMISASHNPAEYNGIKFFGSDGFKLSDETEDLLEALVAKRPGSSRPTGAGIGSVQPESRVTELYAEHLAGTAAVNLRGLKVVLDAGHGAGYRLAPAVLERLGIEVIVISAEPDGININFNCGSTHPERLQAAVTACGAHLGLALDGDADRCIAVDEGGRLVDGDKILAICALDMAAGGLLRGNQVIATVMSNLGLELLLRGHGIKLLRTQVGDRYVLEQMLAAGANLGGEQSGHVIFLDHSTTGDGILTAVQLLGAVVRAGRPLSELAGRLEPVPQLLENVRVNKLTDWTVNPGVQRSIAWAQNRLGDGGRVLVRASGTEPLLRIMLEGPDGAVLQTLAAEIKSVIFTELGAPEEDTQ